MVISDCSKDVQDKGQIFPLLALCYLSNTLLCNLKPFAMAGSMARLRHCALNRRDLAHVGSELPVTRPVSSLEAGEALSFGTEVFYEQALHAASRRGEYPLRRSGHLVFGGNAYLQNRARKMAAISSSASGLASILRFPRAERRPSRMAQLPLHSTHPN